MVKYHRFYWNSNHKQGQVVGQHSSLQDQPWVKGQRHWFCETQDGEDGQNFGRDAGAQSQISAGQIAAVDPFDWQFEVGNPKEKWCNEGKAIINNPPITINRWYKLLKFPVMGGLWHCFTHIMVSTRWNGVSPTKNSVPSQVDLNLNWDWSKICESGDKPLARFGRGPLG